MEKKQNELKTSFILALGKALHQHGTPAYRLELALDKLSQKLKLNGQFLSTPTSLICSFDLPEDGEKTRIIRVEPGSPHLEKLAQVDEVADDVIEGSLSVREGLDKLRQIEMSPNRWSGPVSLISYAIGSGSASLFFQASLIEMIASLVVGLIIGILVLLSKKHGPFEQTFETVCAFVATILAYGLANFYSEISPLVIIVSGMIVLVPGLAITISIAELASQHLMSGTGRLMGALTTFLKMGLGLALGIKLAQLFGFTEPDEVRVSLPFWTQYIGMCVAPLAFTVLFHSRPNEFFKILTVCLLGFFSARLGQYYLGTEIGVFLGGLAIGVFSNMYARITKRPAALSNIPGVILLVPGSMGLKSVSFILNDDIVSGVGSGFHMIIIAIALVAGLFLANLILPPRHTL